MTDRPSTGLPEVDTLVERADAEQAVVDQMMSADRANSAKDSARSAELAARQRRARARLAAARGLRTRAERSGNPDGIRAATERVPTAESQFARTCDRTIDELLQIGRAHSARLDLTMTQIRRTSEARDAVIDAFVPGYRGPG
jgi:hypothetical protein